MEYLLIVAALLTICALAVAGAVRWGRTAGSPSPAESPDDPGEFVTVEGNVIRLWQQGRAHRQADPVVLIPGFAASNWCWRHTVPALSRHRWVVAPDLPGFGLSDKPEGFDYTLAGYARFIVSLMDTMGIQRAVLVGNSMGGGVAIKTALMFPERVARLVLIDSLGYYKRSFKVYRFVALPGIRGLVMSAAGPRSIKLLLKARVYRDPSAVDDETARRFAAAYRTPNGRKAPIWVYRALAPSPTIPPAEIAGVGQPTLIIWGRHDKILPAAHAERFGREIAGARTVIIEEAGHVPHEERPEAVNRLILDFIGPAEARERPE
jgi:pimeloyl-ACP methyl ester carboxylesterase